MSRSMPPVQINSVIDGIVWPGLPAANGLALLALLFQLEQSQWWSPEQLLRRQRHQLQRLLAHAREQTPFYRERLRHVEDLSSTDDWLAAWRKIPPLRRQDIQAADADESMIAQSVPPGHGELTEIHTSGSTGMPIRSVRTELWELIWSAFTVRDHLWHRRDLGGKLAAIRESAQGKASYPDGAVAASWGHASAMLLSTGPMVSLNVASTVEQQAEWLQRHDPDYLLTHPSIAHRLAEHCRTLAIRLPRLKQVMTVAENLRPEVRAACRLAWQAPVTDIYSAREAGYIALQCPDHEHYHIQSEGVFVEVLDERDGPCAPGQVGRLLVTPLHNLAMPLIRYDIGDQVQLGGACACGRGLPVISRIVGRTQNMVTMPSGERRWPLLSSGDIEAMLAAAPAIRQYQFAQRAAELIEARLVAARPLSRDEERALTAWVAAKFGYAFRVEFVYLDALPRTEAGKLEDFVNEIRRS
jgi:phenylacetate-CoA ligase